MRSNQHLLGLLRASEGSIFLRAEIQLLARCSQIDSSIRSLLRRGYLQQINEETFLFNGSPKRGASRGKLKCSNSFVWRISPRIRHGQTSIARFVRAMARSCHVRFQPTHMDRWAVTVTRLAGDEVASDSTDDLLVALTRAGKLTTRDMSRLVAAHRRELKRV